jgi:dihydrolipoamide dehydrogenase
MVVGELTQDTEVLVIGGGPGGYAAAFRAADLGLEVTMIDEAGGPGGVCLYRGCIPSKTLLFVAELLHDAGRAEEMGLAFGRPRVDLERLRGWLDSVIGKLAGGLASLSERRGIQLVQARATFVAPDRVRLHGSEISRFRFRHAIIATGSDTTPLPGVEFREGGRIVDSSGALSLCDIPETLLVVGGGYVGLELGSVFAALGSRVTLVEGRDYLLPGMDQELVRPLRRRVEQSFDSVLLGTRAMSLTEGADRVDVVLDGQAGSSTRSFARVLVAIGRHPNTQGLGLEATKVRLDGRGFIEVDEQCRTSDERIFAVGDVTGGAMLAHKAMREGKVAAEAIAGQPSVFDVRAIPAVVYTDPQVAWCGLTEEQARGESRKVKVSRFPWSASGRAATMGAGEGLTKVVFDAESGRVLGMGIVGRGAGEMIGEGILAVEMGALAEDLALTMHPHPTLSETEGEVAEAFLGSATHLMPTKRQHS